MYICLKLSLEIIKNINHQSFPKDWSYSFSFLISDILIKIFS